MFPPLLCLVLLFGLVPCFPLGVFPLPLLTLKKRLYLREQDTGKGLYLVIGNPCAVVIGLLSARHGITPLKLPLVEQVALKHRTVSGNETASRILWNLFGGAGVVEYDLRKYAVRPAANTEIHVVAYLAGDDGRIRPLRGKNKVDAKRPPLPRDGGEHTFNLGKQLLPLVISSGLVQHLRHLVTGKYEPLKRVLCNLVVGVDVRATKRLERALAVFQYRRELVEGIAQIFLREAHPAFLMPDLGKVHAAFEVGNVDLCALMERLHEQQFQQDALAAARGAA